ncbi:MAG: nucleotidyltransferase domain-containing protein [Bacteroidetes bacterium]|nr:nucleotidyltransferase domain-containing protein [Bacteroidota bacterium]
MAEKTIFQFGKFYSIQNNQELVERRLRGNLLAEKKMKTAERYSRLISLFPFVRAVLLSGSISKGFMDETSDIDYFIITAKKRLWIVRLALAVFRRVFLFNSHKNLCTNYFIDTENLTIPDQNIFTATELCTLKPMYGHSATQKFLDANRWAFTILPQGKFDRNLRNDETFYVKRLIENFFSFKAMDDLNQWLMKKSRSFWKRKYTDVISDHDFEIAFRTREGVSKSHPRFFQKRTLDQFQQRISSFEILNNIDLKF